MCRYITGHNISISLTDSTYSYDSDDSDDSYNFYDRCEYGQINIINLMIKKEKYNWNGGLVRACLGGHLNVVKLMIEKGAYDLNKGLYYACSRGHLDIVKLLIKHGANSWNHIFDHIFDLFDSNIIDFIIDNGILIGSYLKYPKDETKVFRLHELGLPINNLKNMDGFNDFIKDIEDRQNTIKYVLYDHLIDDLIGVVNQYVIN